MKYSDEFIERVREANNLVEIISQHTQLRHTGHQFMGLCPFPDHKEKTPSFSVSEDKQVYHCFGCKKSGNLYTFLQSLNGMSFPEAVEYLARRASIPLPEPEDRPKVSSTDVKDAKAVLLKLNKHAAYFFHQNFLKLPSDHPVREYASRRGLDQELVETFKVGFAPNEWQGLTNYLTRLKAPLVAAERAGLIKAKTGGRNGHFDLFRDRLMFPIYSPLGDVIGFGGRQMGDNQPKYLNSPESPVFNKGRVFYGLHETAKHIRTDDQVIVVEGYMDFLALYGVGIRNVVATLGTALTRDHAKLLKRFTSNVLVLFDGDAAGQSAAERSLPILLEAGCLVKGLILPDGLDPDDFLRKFGDEALRKAMREAPELFSIFLKAAMKDYQGLPGDKVTVVDRVGPVLQATQDRRLKELYLKQVSERLNVEMRWLVNAIAPPKAHGQMHGQPNAPKPQAGPTPRAQQSAQGVEKPNDPVKIKVQRPLKPELVLINLGLKDEAYLKEILAAGMPEKMSHPALRAVMMRIAEVYGQAPADFDKLTAFMASQVEPASVVTQHLEPTFAAAGRAEDRKLLQDCFKSVQDHFLKSQAKALALELRESPSPEQLEQFMNIQRDRRILFRKDNNQG